MRQHFIFVLAILCLTSLLAVTGFDKQIQYDLKLVHLNAHWLYATSVGLPHSVATGDLVVGSDDKRALHINTVIRYLRTTDADLIHLTEVQGDAVLDTIVSQLNSHIEEKDKKYRYYMTPDTSYAASVKGIVYQHVAFISRLPMIGKPSRSSDVMPNVGHAFFQHIVAKFRLPDNRILFAAGVHLKRQPSIDTHHDEEMNQVLSELQNRGAKAKNVNHVVAILGDFNEVLPFGDAIIMSSCDSYIKEHYNLINPVRSSMMEGQNPSVRPSCGIGLIDSILVSKAFARASRATPSIPGLGWVRRHYGTSLSDHSPVVLTFRVNEPKFVMKPKTPTMRADRHVTNIYDKLSREVIINSDQGSETDECASAQGSTEDESILYEIEGVKKRKCEKRLPKTKTVQGGKRKRPHTPSTAAIESDGAHHMTHLITLFYRFPYGLTAMLATVTLIIYQLHQAAAAGSKSTPNKKIPI